MKVAVEAKDHSRPIGPGTIEEYVGKYSRGDGIGINQVVVVSKRGFTRSAKDRARAANIILLTLQEAKDVDWTQLIPRDQLKELRFQVARHFHKISLDPPLLLDFPRWLSEAHVVCACGRDNGTIWSYLQHQVSCHLLPERWFQTQLREGLQTHNGNVLATARVPLEGKVLILNGQEHRAESMTAELHFCEATGPCEMEVYEQVEEGGTKIVIQRVRAKVAGKSLDVVIPEGRKAKQITVHISDDSACAHKKAG
jgi:hypothetical protein